ncbi:MAG TPA: tRNA (adenosine(37)-N6)-threonylcarbamoyltransferase complex dimerization subunit type 1 TsaB [Terriglobales bacterium]|jgi:tRNA threonylcarbamoyladenosine biosynthesis protein TsaB
MLLLAADTSGKFGSIVVARCEPPSSCEVLGIAALEGGTFSAQLIPQIAALLKRLGLSKSDIEGFAVVSGPGSFTGLRIGLAAIKALAEILGKPIAAISLLEAVAAAANTTGRVTSALEAGRGEIYIAEYATGEAEAILSSAAHEQLCTREEFIARASALVVTPDARIADLARAAGKQVLQVDCPHADAIAALGWKKMQAHMLVSPEELEANYIRRTDAELLSKLGG